jgi:hypothetical protein
MIYTLSKGILTTNDIYLQTLTKRGCKLFNETIMRINAQLDNLHIM